MFVTYESFAMVSASMNVQHAKWLGEAIHLPWRAPVASLNILLTSTCWRNDHNGFSHQGPGLIDVMLSKRGNVARIYLPPDANSLLSVADHCLQSRYVNLIVIETSRSAWLSIDAAASMGRGASVWIGGQRGRRGPTSPARGDTPIGRRAAAWWLRRIAPEPGSASSTSSISGTVRHRYARTGCRTRISSPSLRETSRSSSVSRLPLRSINSRHRRAHHAGSCSQVHG
jgi:xylulose-5-phosphate/fructose-6-phosphate phosphoketolase